MNEKWAVTKWVLLVIVLGVLTTAVGWVLWPVSTRVEREVMVQSHQYKEGMAERVAIMQATIAEIDARLAANPEPKTRAELEAQRSVVKAQLNAARR